MANYFGKGNDTHTHDFFFFSFSFQDKIKNDMRHVGIRFEGVDRGRGLQFR